MSKDDAYLLDILDAANTSTTMWILKSSGTP
jgi:hypothetical protein